jgi:hypothetical protein
MDKSKIVVGTLAALAIVSAVGFGLMFMRLGQDCMSGSDGASCPAVAEVEGVRYYVGSSHDLVNVEGALTPFAQIARTNSSRSFLSMSTYALSGVDPAKVLVAENAPSADQAGRYRLLHSELGEAAEHAEVCPYISAADLPRFDYCPHPQ